MNRSFFLVGAAIAIAFVSMGLPAATGEHGQTATYRASIGGRDITITGTYVQGSGTNQNWAFAPAHFGPGISGSIASCSSARGSIETGFTACGNILGGTGHAHAFPGTIDTHAVSIRYDGIWYAATLTIFG